MDQTILSAIATTVLSIISAFLQNVFKNSKKTNFDLLSKIFSPLKYVIDYKYTFQNHSQIIQSINNVIKVNYYLTSNHLKMLVLQVNKSISVNDEIFKKFEEYITVNYNTLSKKVGCLLENKYDRYLTYLNTYLEIASFPTVIFNILLQIINSIYNHNISLLESLSQIGILLLILNIIFLSISNRLSKKLYDR